MQTFVCQFPITAKKAWLTGEILEAVLLYFYYYYYYYGRSGLQYVDDEGRE